jgi:hypothetical protein
MPSGLPERLSGEDAGLYRLIGSFLTRGTGADSAYRILREQGAGITRQTVRNAFGQLRSELDARADLARLNPRNIISEAKYTPDPTIRGQKFVTRVTLSLVDQVTGLVGVQHYSYVTHGPVSPDEAIGAALDSAGPGQSFEGFDVVAAQVTNALTNL